MPPSLLLGFLTFTLVSAFTPGPNNLIALSTGVGFGFVAALPHVLGVAVGFAVMTLVVGVGAGLVFERWPWVQTVLLLASTIYLMYLAWNLARSGSFHAGGVSRPLSFAQSVAIQWLNPKAWAAILTILGAFVPADAFWPSLVVVILVDVAVAAAAVATWAAFGTVLKRWLEEPARLRVFNVIMAVLLVLSLLPSYLH